MRSCLRVIALALVLACGREASEPAPATSQVESAPVDPLGRLDPGPYRAKIEAAETLLYSDEGLSDEGWKALSKALLELHNEIVFRDESGSGRETSARLFFLSARADATTGNSHGDTELAQIRELWRRLSEEKFTPAAWLRASSSGP